MSVDLQETVTPSEVHADSFSESDAAYNESHNGYIALVFPDTMFPVKERSLVLGRDQRLQDFLQKHTTWRVSREQPPFSPLGRQEYEAAVANTILGDDGQDSDLQQDDDEDFLPTEPRFASLEGGIATFDINLHQRDNEDETFLPIHPPGDESTGRFPRLGAISKRHLRLFLDEEQECWMLEVLGRNGAFVNDDWIQNGQIIPLEHLAKVGVGDLNFKVLLENVNDSELESAMSGSSDEEEESVSRGESETTPESDLQAPHTRKGRTSSSLLDSDEDEQSATPRSPAPAKAKPKSTTKLKLKVPQPTKPAKEGKEVTSPKDKDKTAKKPKESSEEATKKVYSLLREGEEPGKRKGPGRPPANGLMSKREMKERQKALSDASKGNRDGFAGSSLLPIDAGAETEPRGDGDDKLKNKKRKRSETTGDPKAEVDRKKRLTPEKSPEPTEDQFTPEQLQAPGLTYVVIIYQILKDKAPEQLNLQQLYREMKKKYPYYRFRPKPGWESSVRHTVSAENFIKGEKDGKGYKYTYNPEKPPAPQKQKQVTTSSTGPYPPAPPPGQFQPGSYPGGPYSQTYAGKYSQTPYSNLALQGPRPVQNGMPQGSSYNTSSNLSQQLPPTRNPQNSPYPLNPPFSLQPGQQASSSTPNYRPPNHLAPQPPPGQQPHASASAPRLDQPVQNEGASTSQPAQTNLTGQDLSHQTQGIATPATSTTNPFQFKPTQTTTAVTSNSSPQLPNTQKPQQPQIQPPSQPNSGHPGPAPSPGPSNTQTQQLPRPPSQPGAQQASTVLSKTPLPSEELAAGRIPRILLEFETNMRRMTSNMPQKQQDLENKAINDAMVWVKANPNKEFKPEPGMSSYTVSVISSFISMINRRDADMRRQRQYAAANNANQEGEKR